VAEEEVLRPAEDELHQVRQTLEYLQARMMSKDPVDEKELTMLSRMVATQMEMLRSRLEEALGPVPREEMLEELKSELSEEDFEEFLASEPDRLAFQEEIRQEARLREQLETGDKIDG
jgi:hypothetical protein